MGVGGPGASAVTERSGHTARDLEVMAVREMVGLSTDPAHVRDVMSRQGDLPTEYGVPVTAEEVVEIQRRRHLGEAGARLAGRLTSIAGSTFAGSWLDARTSIWHFAFTAPIGSNEKALIAEALPPGTDVEIEIARHSMAAIRNLQDGLQTQASALDQMGIQVNGSSYLEREQELEILVSGPPDNAREILLSMFGSVAEVVRLTDSNAEDQLSRDRSTGPAYGGLFYNDGGPNPCTVGNARAESNSKPGQFYLVSAGHCSVVGRTAYFGRSGGSVLGGVVKSYDVGPTATTSCDCLLIGPLGSGRITDDALVDHNNVHNFSAAGRDEASYWIDRPVCVSGANSFEQRTASDPYGIICSRITSTQTRKQTQKGTYLIDLIRTASGETIPGDSGAPWGDGGNLLGIHQGIFDEDSVFSRASRIPGLNVTLRW